MWNKHCKKLHPMTAMDNRGSYVWKEMIEVREVDMTSGGK